MLPTSHQILLKQRNYISCLENARVNKFTVRLIVFRTFEINANRLHYYEK